jgi:hypothetical protein
MERSEKIAAYASSAYPYRNPDHFPDLAAAFVAQLPSQKDGEIEQEKKEEFNDIAGLAGEKNKLEYEDADKLYEKYANEITADGVMDGKELERLKQEKPRLNVYSDFSLADNGPGDNKYFTPLSFMYQIFGPGAEKRQLSLTFEEAERRSFDDKLSEDKKFKTIQNSRPASPPFQELDRQFGELRWQLDPILEIPSTDEDYFKKLNLTLQALRVAVSKCPIEISRAAANLYNWMLSDLSWIIMRPAAGKRRPQFEMTGTVIACRMQIGGIIDSLKNRLATINNALAQNAGSLPSDAEATEPIDSFPKLAPPKPPEPAHLDDGAVAAANDPDFINLSGGGLLVRPKVFSDIVRTCDAHYPAGLFDREEWGRVLEASRLDPKRYTFDSTTLPKITLGDVEYISVLSFYKLFENKFRIYHLPASDKTEFGINATDMISFFAPPEKAPGKGDKDGKKPAKPASAAEA